MSPRNTCMPTECKLRSVVFHELDGCWSGGAGGGAGAGMISVVGGDWADKRDMLDVRGIC